MDTERELPFSDEELILIEAAAKRRGFESVAAYLMALIAEDLEHPKSREDLDRVLKGS